MQIRPTFFAILSVFVFSLTGYALTAASIYLRMVYLSGFLIAFSFLWTYFSLRGLSVRRSARFLRQQVGQVFEERYELVNDFWLFKLWIDVRDRSTLPGGSGSKVLTWIGGNQRRSYVGYTRLTRRGQFLLGPTVISSGDPFGLFYAAKTFPADRHLLVLPYMVDLQNLPKPPGFLPGGRALRRRTLEVTPYAAGVREYAPGDALNRIHWPTTARKDRLIVKEFDQDPQADIWIMLDAQRSVHLIQNEQATFDHTERYLLWRNTYRITLPNNTFEYGVSIVASMANAYIQEGLAVGLASEGKSFTILPAERGERQLGKLLEMFAYLSCEGALPLTGLVQAQARYLVRGSTVVLVTPSLDVKSLEGAVEELLHRQLQPVVVLLDRTTFYGLGDLEAALLMLRSRRVPVAVVQRGADLKQALETGFH